LAAHEQWRADPQRCPSLKQLFIYSLKSSVTTIISNTSLSGSYTSCDHSNINDFVFLKKFNIDIHPPKAPKIIEVLWNPPPFHWIKCNTDGSSNMQTSSCGGIFRNRNADILLCFAENIGHESAYFAELSGAMRAIELAKQHNCRVCGLNQILLLLLMHSKTFPKFLGS